MVAASDYAFRCVCRQHGVDLTYTQMLQSKLLLNDKSFGPNHVDWHECDEIQPYQSSSSADQRPLLLRPAQIRFLGDMPQLRRVDNGNDNGNDNDNCSLPPHLQPFVSGPLVVQLAGHDVHQVVKAAHLVVERTQGRVTGIDLNLGTH